MSYFIQKAIDIAEVNPKRVTIDMADYIVMPKYDGCHGLVTISPDGHVVPRTSSGDPWLSAPKAMLNALYYHWAKTVRPAGTYVTYCGEAWIPGVPHSQINGTFRRQTPQDDLLFVLFDCLVHTDPAVLRDHNGYMSRFKGIVGFGGPNLTTADYETFNTLAEAEQFAREYKAYTAGEYDGAVLVHKYRPYTPGRCRDGEKIKLKPLLEFDLKVLRFNPAAGEKTGKQTGALTVAFRGKELNVAVLREDDLAELHNNPDAWTGKLVAVEAMGYSSKGLLREPRLKGLRIDKETPDA